MEPLHQPVCACPNEDVVRIIGKKWTLCLVTVLGNGHRVRFNELIDALPGISPKTLSDALKELRDEGLVERKAFAEVPPKVEYSLTGEGWRLRAAILPLMEWAAERSS